MEERILEFIGDLRRAEIRISTAEALDALGASAEVGLTDRETFKATLASTLIKEARDEETFNRIFNLYFLDLEALGEGLKKALGPEDPRVQDQLDQVMDQENMDLDELTELLMNAEGSQNHTWPPAIALTPKNSVDHPSHATTLRRNAMTRSSSGRSSKSPWLSIRMPMTRARSLSTA